MMKTPFGHKVYAMAAEYPSAAALYEAAKRVRDAGFRRWDVYSPFPIHGMCTASRGIFGPSRRFSPSCSS